MADPHFARCLTSQRDTGGRRDTIADGRAHEAELRIRSGHGRWGATAASPALRRGGYHGKGKEQ